MAKKSALDLKIAECDAGMAAAHEELARWRGLRAFLTGSEEAVTGDSILSRMAAPKPKRTRGKNKTKPNLDGSQPALAARAAMEPQS